MNNKLLTLYCFRAWGVKRQHTAKLPNILVIPNSQPVVLNVTQPPQSPQSDDEYDDWSDSDADADEQSTPPVYSGDL